MKNIFSRTINLALTALVLVTSINLLTTTSAFALNGSSSGSTPMTSGCLGGTLVKSQAFSHGTIRIYRSCGGYYAQFGSNGGRRTFRLQVINGYAPGYSSIKSFSYVYGGWTDLIPAACVSANYTSGGSSLAYIKYGC